ncbi:2740_t:CDS:2 [Funneliformis geosporum]|uniref:2740_t:CDS:1 n=1 Tax=Funneliformis geosporum TaxID=1117311 RepID=A0A9W4WME1_9GLOM|nr:2740_t:CDS:2 [Funneliformis geosporum]
MCMILIQRSKPTKPTLSFLIPFPYYTSYPYSYSTFSYKKLPEWSIPLFDFLIPQSNPFIKANNEFYKTWNGKALINFKWRVYGKYYYITIWLIYTIFLYSFIVASSEDEETRNYFLLMSIFLGCFHLLFEFRQFIWNPYRWLLNFWNFIDLGAYLLPTVTSIIWYKNGVINPSLYSISCLILEMKFILFLRAFEPFGVYFAIILGPTSYFSEDNLGNLTEPNNPWSLTDKYYQVDRDGNINKNMTIYKVPDNYTNLFSNYANSLLAMSIFLTGDGSIFNKWSPKDNIIMIILMLLYSFIIVIFLMNLLIGLLNMAIEADNDRLNYIAQKAEILKEIELFYFLPNQKRRWKSWFPETIYYYAEVNEVKKFMDKETIDSETKKKLLNIIRI